MSQNKHTEGTDLPTEDPDTNTRLSKAQSGRPQSSKADTSDQSPIVGEIETILKAFDKGELSTGHATEDLLALLAAQRQRWQMEARLDEIGRTARNDCKPKYMLDRINELQGALATVPGEQAAAEERKEQR